MSRSLLGVMAVLTVLVTPLGARAQQQAPVYYYFDDDPLQGDGLSGTIPQLVVRTKKLPRVMLIRPRAQFVAELLKSVETL